MAPKRKTRAVVKKTKKVVEETVQVTIIDDGENAAEIAMEEGMEAGDDVMRTTVIEKRVQIPIESQNLEEPVLETPRKGEDDRGVRGTEKERSPEDKKGDETGDETGEPETDNGDGTGEPETGTGDETGEPETDKGDETGEPEPKEGSVKTPEKQEVGRRGKRDEGVGGGETKKRKKRRRRSGEGIGGGKPEQYKRYVYKVLKQVHPELGISSAGMEVLNAYMNDMFEKLVDEAARLSRYTERKTLSSREVQSAVRLVLPGELGRHAIAEGAKAVTNYMSYSDE